MLQRDFLRSCVLGLRQVILTTFWNQFNADSLSARAIIKIKNVFAIKLGDRKIYSVHLHRTPPEMGGGLVGLGSASATGTQHTFVSAGHSSGGATDISFAVRLGQTRGVTPQVARDKICTNPGF